MQGPGSSGNAHRQKRGQNSQPLSNFSPGEHLKYWLPLSPPQKGVGIQVRRRISNFTWARHDIFITQDTEVTQVTEMNLWAEIYIVCKKPMDSRSILREGGNRQVWSLRQWRCSMKKTKFFFKKIKYVDDADFCFSKGGVSSGLPHSLPHRSSLRIASHTDAAGIPARGPISASRDVELGPPRTKPLPVLLSDVRCQMSDVNSFPSFLWVRGGGSGRGGLPASGPLSGLFHNRSPKPPSALVLHSPPEALLDVEPSGTLASFNSRQGSRSGGTHLRKINMSFWPFAEWGNALDILLSFLSWEPLNERRHLYLSMHQFIT